MKSLGVQLARLTHLLVALLKPLGFWGAGAIALLDSSTIPVPMDVILATYMWNDRAHAALYVLMGAVGVGDWRAASLSAGGAPGARSFC